MRKQDELIQTVMAETVRNCPLCGDRESSLFDQRAFHGESVTNRICARCGLVFQSPRRTAEELAGFYENEYRQLYQGSAGPTPKDLAVQDGRAETLLAFAGPRIERISRHLDIGCSAGLLLQYFQGKFHCQTVGVEPGKAYREFAQRQGFRVYPSLEELQASGEGPFDLVSLAHVLEHIPEPVIYLDSLRKTLLAPDGRLLVEVPNLYAHDSFEVAHLVAFSLHTLNQVLRKSGFEVLTWQQHGQPRSRLIPLYVTVLARPLPSPKPFQIQPDHGVRLKRQLGLLHRRLLSRLLPQLAWSKVTGDQ